jgi:hypothetical protein
MFCDRAPCSGITSLVDIPPAYTRALALGIGLSRYRGGPIHPPSGNRYSRKLRQLLDPYILGRVSWPRAGLPLLVSTS